MTPHLAIVGPTASGKSALAMELARAFDVFEVVSVDSMQVYRGMDIGTAKPTAAEQAEVRHHLIDLVDPTEDFTLSEYQASARATLADIESRGRRALLVGGTGLYLQAVIDDLDIPGQFPEVRAELEVEPSTPALHARLSLLDPIAAARMEPDNRRRVLRALEVSVGSGRPFSSFGPGVDAFPATPFRQVGLWVPRPVGAARIEHRVKAMIDAGWPAEVDRLRSGGPLSRTAAQALGYKELLASLPVLRAADGASTGSGDRVPTSVVDEIVARTRSFARRQRVWFRRDPRIEWFGAPLETGALRSALLRDCQEWLRATGG